ncbi:hypothetical protein DFH08DRAFT_76143 [Mycena albidolilacea]|uniref:Uncharacterized protein n=1 Tax=Mycena albidolilacea TaxID=1033008 RepID=A0AAD6YZG9_9AGAR|nr:hypothetical protein DFH08DRAFT_76143 [Mycena albidolilacea]
MHILFPSCLGSTQSLKTLVPLWLQRAHNRPLFIALSGADIDYDVVSIIWNHAQQLKHLDIIEVDMAADEVPLWKGTILGPWPSLETLSIFYLLCIWCRIVPSSYPRFVAPGSQPHRVHRGTACCRRRRRNAGSSEAPSTRVTNNRNSSP